MGGGDVPEVTGRGLLLQPGVVGPVPRTACPCFACQYCQRAVTQDGGGGRGGLDEGVATVNKPGVTGCSARHSFVVGMLKPFGSTEPNSWCYHPTVLSLYGAITLRCCRFMVLSPYGAVVIWCYIVSDFSFVKCCFTSTETVGTIRDGELRTATSIHTAPELWRVFSVSK